MSQCRYHTTLNNVAKVYAKINSIQTVVCEYDLIGNELGERIGFDNFELDFKQFDYIVSETAPTCEFLAKGGYSTSIKKIKFSADIRCSDVDLQQIQHLLCLPPKAPTHLDLEPKKAQSPYELEIDGEIENFDSHLLEFTEAGSDLLLVADQEFYRVGDIIVIDEGGAHQEFNQIVGFGSIKLKTATLYNHAKGAKIRSLKGYNFIPEALPTPTVTDSITQKLT